MRLLTRTTRSVAPTEAGERLIGTVAPAFDSIGAQLASMTELRERAAGSLRITAGEHVRVLQDWCPRFTGYHLYYPSRRQPSAAFILVVNALRTAARGMTEPPGGDSR